MPASTISFSIGMICNLCFWRLRRRAAVSPCPRSPSDLPQLRVPKAPPLPRGLDFLRFIWQTRNDGQNWIRKPNSLRARERPGLPKRGKWEGSKLEFCGARGFPTLWIFFNEMLIPIQIPIAIKNQFFSFCACGLNKKKKQEKRRGKKRKTRNILCVFSLFVFPFFLLQL